MLFSVNLASCLILKILQIEVNALFPNVNTFRKALRHFAIKNEFEVRTVKSDRKRFIGECKHPSYPWKIHASIF
jgi:MuDR family transposase